MPLSLNDAIKRALENNNDIEVARDDVRFAETQLRALEGIFDPVFAITPQYDKRISPQQSSLGGGSHRYDQHDDLLVGVRPCRNSLAAAVETTSSSFKTRTPTRVTVSAC